MFSMTLLAMPCAGEPSLAGLTASAMSAGLAPRSPMASSGCGMANNHSYSYRANPVYRPDPLNNPTPVNVQLAYQYFGLFANCSDEEVRTAYRDKCRRISIMQDQWRAQTETAICEAHYQVLRQRRNMNT